MSAPAMNTPASAVGAVDPHAASPAIAVARVVAAGVALAIAWGVLAGATEHHFAYASLLVGLALARVLTSTAARRLWFPALAAGLAFGVGFVGDVLGVGLDLNWRYQVPIGRIIDHFGELFDTVSSSHGLADWLFFTLAAVCAAALTASRQRLGRDAFTRPSRPDRRAVDTCPDPSAPRRP